MRKTIITTTCDNHVEVEAAVSVTFQISGASAREVDLCTSCSHALAQFTGNARRAEASKLTLVPAAQRPNRRDPAMTERIRSWARANGHAVKDRGRIPAVVEDAYVRAVS